MLSEQCSLNLDEGEAVRLWSLHPQYLDAKGLVALWREALLARRVLQGRTHGYRRHPQLERFEARPDTLAAIEVYLLGVYAEAVRRGYHFDTTKVDLTAECLPLPVTVGQLHYELHHLKQKLKGRDRACYRRLVNVGVLDAHPLFQVVSGDIEAWERVAQGKRQTFSERARRALASCLRK